VPEIIKHMNTCWSIWLNFINQYNYRKVTNTYSEKLLVNAGIQDWFQCICTQNTKNL